MSKQEKEQFFETFAGHFLVAREFGAEFTAEEIDSVVVGGHKDDQLDVIALALNGRLVATADDIERELSPDADEAEAVWVLVQATKSQAFDPGKMHRFADGALRLFLNESLRDENPGLSAKRELNLALEQFAKDNGVALRSRVCGYYAARADWPGLANDERRLKFNTVAGAIAKMQSGAAAFDPVDLDRLAEIVDAVDRRRERSELARARAVGFDYEARLPTGSLVGLPAIEGVGGGYIGTVPARAFLSVLEREDGQGLREGIFHHNVRGFLEESLVNQKIRETLQGEDRRQFVLRNNGVTIVAEEIETDGGDVVLHNYQIVNGLQTSNIIYQMKDDILAHDDVHLTVKLVEADDWSVQRGIIEATNRQNAVQGSAQFAAYDKAIVIERFFMDKLARGEGRLRLDRRVSKPAVSDGVRPITLEHLLRAYFAVCDGRAHTAQEGFGALRDLLDEDLLGPKVGPDAYYAVACLLDRVRDVDQRREPPHLGRIEYQAALALRVILAPDLKQRLTPEAASLRLPAIAARLDDSSVAQAAADRLIEATRKLREAAAKDATAPRRAKSTQALFDRAQRLGLR